MSVQYHFRGLKLFCAALLLCGAWAGLQAQTTHIYAMGSTSSGPGYWLDGTWVSLPLPPGATYGTVQSIAVSGSDVYASGYGDSNPSEYGWRIPGYWLNGNWVALNWKWSTASSGGVPSIVVAGGDVYAAANNADAFQNEAGYWMNGTLITLPMPSGNNGAQVSGLTVSGSDLYAWGNLYTNANGDSPGYWLDGNWVGLTTQAGGTFGAAYNLSVTGQDVYVAGMNTGFGIPLLPGYWKNGDWNNLTPQSGAIGGETSSIVFSGSHLYVAGYSILTYNPAGGIRTYSPPGYWEDGTWVGLPLQSGMTVSSGQAISLVVSGSDVYAASDFGLPGYWKNGIWVNLALPNGATSGEVQSILVEVVVPPLSMTTTSLPGGVIGASYSNQLTATGGTAPYIWSATGLPPGINLSASGLLAGTPTTVGSYSPTITVEDASTPQRSSTVDFTIAIAAQAPSFTVAGTAATISTPGVSTGNTSTITITPAGGFNGNVSLTATLASSPSGAVHLPTLSFGSTSPVNIVGTTAGTATLTISTTAATTSSLVFPQLPGHTGSGTPWYATGGATLACLLLFGIPARRRSWRSMLGLVLLFAGLAFGMVACGGGGSATSSTPPQTIPGTTAGAYTVTVIGTDVATGKIASSTTVNLTVN